MCAWSEAEPADVAGEAALLRLLQLASPALPVGAFAYSQGLEWAVEAGWVKDESGAGEWIGGLLEHSLARADVPVFARLHRAWHEAAEPEVEYWNAWLGAVRESAELQAEDRHLGAALARLLADLGEERARAWAGRGDAGFATLFALAAVSWGIPVRSGALGLLWAWTENQVAAATKLIPLGQTAAQRLLSALQQRMPVAVEQGLALEEAAMGMGAPGLALAGALHETQYTRLFRS